ncbi:MAG: hypothetical protein CVU54_18685 [Deltaproteobacteria bacterium HGW-Deltaproteobacteria-12]|jgi:metal-responsive CopG/Arc/MetJ family transcriptional regulator|nr:MAG: hypothetical protein CVU54_18685 [Deltaproteobacteria bacterium HGW-Deltaproteobacteria-12]
MHTETVRINVILPKDLIKSVNKIAGPRSRSYLIAESLREYIRKIEQNELDKRLEYGYRASAEESILLADEFKDINLEGCDEY